MQSRLAVMSLGLLSIGLVSCYDGPPTIFVLAPVQDDVIESCSVDVEFELRGLLGHDPIATINGVELDLTRAFYRNYSAAIPTDLLVSGLNTLEVSAAWLGDPTIEMETVTFTHDLSSTSARPITSVGELITGPLAHGRVGDYLLENCFARFIVQDVNQRDLYSVGGFGGNVIDAELVGHPGLDNFLEVQPMLNLETVINATSVVVVNDGTDGNPGIVRTCGPDDLLDFVDPSVLVLEAGLPFPAEQDDNNQNIDGCTEYSLAKSDRYLEMATTINNNETTDLRMVTGDWINGSGEFDIWVSPNAGIGPALVEFLTTMSFIGYGEASGVDYSLTLEKTPGLEAAESTYFSTSGVSVLLHHDNVLGLLFFGQPPSFLVTAGGSRTYTRYFGVGDGSGTRGREVEYDALGTAHGTLEGCVTVAGVPAPGTRVTALNTEGSPVIAATFITDDAGCYSGKVEALASASAAAMRDGTLFEGGGSSPLMKAISITAGATTTVDFDLPATGAVQVSVLDHTASAIPARVTIVGFDPSVQAVIAGFALPGVGATEQALFRDPEDRLPFGVARAIYTDALGTAEFDLEPGSYQVYVSRGTEYSAYDEPITVTAGDTTVVAASIARVIDSTGFISSDFHVHGINSADSVVTHRRRVRQFAGEGVENIVMTDHHAHTDLDPTIAAEGFSAFVASTIGEEVTTFTYGHFNAYPLTIDATQPSGGSTDWGVAAPAGLDFPSDGAYNATPPEVFALGTTGTESTAATTMQINHISSHFQALQIDTSLVPPSSAFDAAARLARRLDPAGGPLFQHFPALELWNGDSRGSQSSFLDGRMGVWFNHLNQGLLTTAIGDTDTHKFTNLNSAGARSWTASPANGDGDASLIDSADVARAVDAGRVVGGQGIFVTTRLLADDGSMGVADLTLAGSTEVASSTGDVSLEIHVQAPEWAQFDTIEIYANASTTHILDGGVDPTYLFTVTPTQTLVAGVDFSVTTVAVNGSNRLDTIVTLPYSALVDDTWFAVVAKGTDNVSEPMFPVYPDSLSSSSNPTLADLVDGNLNENGVMALGFTNALYADVDGTPGFQAPLAP